MPMHPMKTESVHAQEAGFTLIEVMVALLLTVIAVIGIVALYMVETRASGSSRHENEASVLAEDKMEDLRTIAAPTGPMAGTTSGLNEEDQVVAGGLYTRAWTITPDIADGYNNIVVTVSWSEDGTPRSITEYGRY